MRTKVGMAIVSICLLFFAYSCEDMNDIHEKYIKRGEGLYIGAADSIKVFSGLHKIGFEWQINADPRISKAVIYWNRRDTCVSIPVVRTSESEMRLTALLDNIAEGEYVFEFEMQDDNGNISKTVEISGAVLGDVYVENLRNRGVKELAKLVTGDMQITWEAVSATAASLQYSVVEYVNAEGILEVIEVQNDEEVTLLHGLNTGDEVNIFTIHLPENGLETFESIKRKFFMPKFERLMDKLRFKDAFKPGDNTSPQPGDNINAWANSWAIADNRDIRQIWDNNLRNDAVGGFRGILHTNDKSGDANPVWQFPHQFTFEIGAEATLSRLIYHARVDNGSFTGHSPRFFEVWATDVPKTIADFENQAAFEKYYRTTYVTQKDPNNYVANNENYTDRLSRVEARCVTNKYVAASPEPGIYNWQQDWILLGDFEAQKPSGTNHGQRNDADNAVWAAGFEFNLNDVGKKVRYIRLVIKFPNWDTSNCINMGEVTFYGDDI